MKKITALMLLFATASIVTANENADHAMHQADVFVDGSTVDIDPDQIKQFTSDLQGGQVAVVSVMGMVCDFCARGIEKPSSAINLWPRSMSIFPRARC